MQYEKPDKSASALTPPDQMQTPRYDFQPTDSRSYSLQFPASDSEKKDKPSLGCELRIS
jgi:hypothetical protein